MALFLLLLALLLTLTYYYFFTRNFTYWKSRGVLHQKPVFFFGNLLDYILGNEFLGKYIATFYNQFEGPYFGFYAFNRPCLVLKDPNIIERVLLKDFQFFPNRILFCNEHTDAIGDSLIGVKVPRWKYLREKLSFAYTSGRLKMMLPQIKDIASNLKKRIETVLNKDVEVKGITTKFAIDVISFCGFGISPTCLTEEDSEIETSGKNLFKGSPLKKLQGLSHFFVPLAVKLFRFTFFRKEPVEFLVGVFREAMNKREINRSKRNDITDILVDIKNEEENGRKLQSCDDKVPAQGLAFFAGGYESTSSIIAFTLHELCINEIIQDRLREEILKMNARYKDLSYEAIKEMKYLHMVVQEILRKYPVFSFINRECVKDYKIPETGLVIEKNTPVLIPQHGLQWDSKYFPQPEKYDPERFSDHNETKIPSFVHFPFSEGPRNCIGARFGLLAIKVALVCILKNFKIESNLCTKEPLVFQPSALLSPVGGIHVTFRKL